MRRYQPKNSILLNKDSFFLLVYTIVLGCFIVGPIGYWFTLATFPPVPPLVMGWLNGLVIQHGIKRWKIARPLLAIGVALLMGIFSYMTLHYGFYWRFRGEIREVIVQDTGITDYAQTNQMTDDFLRELVGTDGFLGYLRLMAQEGVSALRISPTFGNITVTGLSAWLFWPVELLMIIVFSSIISRKAARQPFCYTCNNWYEYEQVGSTTPEQQMMLLNYLHSGDYGSAGHMLLPESQTNPSVELYVGECKCDDEKMENNVLKVSHVRLNPRGAMKIKDIDFGVVTPDEADELIVAIPD